MKTAPKLLAIAFVVGLVVGTGAMAAYQQASQPHMTAALDALQQAQHHLQEAQHNKGGHRAMAEQSTKDAIMHTKEGIAAGEENASK